MCRSPSTSSTASSCRARSSRSTNTSCCCATRSRRWSTSTPSRPSCPRARSTWERRRKRSRLPEKRRKAAAAPAADHRAAIIVCLDFGDDDFEERVEEVVRLAESAGVTRHRVIRGRRSRPDPKFYAGTGKVEEIARAAAELNAGYVVFNHEMSPAQQRNVEKELNVRTLDRTELILEIFAQRAQTNEGKLQVELARLEHLSTRLVRGWTHLERQRGGFGSTGGPGEKQIELDRRYIAQRVKILKEKILSLKRQRQVQRRARVRRDVLSVSIVGYTNAGKSTLFNALTHAKAYEADQL